MNINKMLIVLKNTLVYLSILILTSCNTLRVSNKPDLRILGTVPKAPILSNKEDKISTIKKLIDFSISLRIYIDALSEYLKYLARD